MAGRNGLKSVNLQSLEEICWNLMKIIIVPEVAEFYKRYLYGWKKVSSLPNVPLVKLISAYVLGKIHFQFKPGISLVSYKNNIII